MAGFFVSAPMANGTLTNDYVVGSLGPSGPSPLRVRASRRGCESAVLGRFGESNRAYQCCTEEPARWRVFLCPRQWPTGLSPTTASLAHSGRPGPRPAGPRLAARLRIGRPWPIRRVQSRLPMLYRRTRPMAGFLLPAPLAAIGSHQRLRRWFTRAVLALALRVRASRCGCESAVLGRFGESHRALGGLSAGRVCAVFTIAARAAAPVQSKKMPDKAGEPYTC